MLASSLLSLSSAPAPRNYIQSLRMLEGTPYETLNCSEYICVARHHPSCQAADFWSDGCNGDAVVIQEAPRFEAIDPDKLQPGDVIAFHGVHVAAYVVNGVWMDSDFRHDGVGLMHRNGRRGGWFFGPVKILRWKDTSWQSQ